MKKINLEEIIHNSIVNDLILKDVESGQAIGIANKIISKDWYIKIAMLEFGKQLLELAAEKAELKRDNYFSLSDAEQMVCIEIWNEADLVPSEGVVINKQSILDTIKQVE